MMKGRGKKKTKNYKRGRERGRLIETRKLKQKGGRRYGKGKGKAE